MEQPEQEEIWGQSVNSELDFVIYLLLSIQTPTPYLLVAYIFKYQMFAVVRPHFCFPGINFPLSLALFHILFPV